jgi:hypothetical protein
MMIDVSSAYCNIGKSPEYCKGIGGWEDLSPLPCW